MEEDHGEQSRAEQIVMTPKRIRGRVRKYFWIYTVEK